MRIRIFFSSSNEAPSLLSPCRILEWHTSGGNEIAIVVLHCCTANGLENAYGLIEKSLYEGFMTVSRSPRLDSESVVSFEMRVYYWILGLYRSGAHLDIVTSPNGIWKSVIEAISGTLNLEIQFLLDYPVKDPILEEFRCLSGLISQIKEEVDIREQYSAVLPPRKLSFCNSSELLLTDLTDEFWALGWEEFYYSTPNKNVFFASPSSVRELAVLLGLSKRVIVPSGGSWLEPCLLNANLVVTNL